MSGPVSRIVNGSGNSEAGPPRPAYRPHIMRSVFVLIGCRGEA
jgi:hypothetical protein